MKQIMRKILVLFLVLGVLSGCTTSSKTKTIELPEDKYELVFALDGEKITLPMKFADFEAMGWKTGDDTSVQIKPDRREIISLSRDDLVVYANVSNPSNSVITAKEGFITGITVEGSHDAKDKVPNIQLSGNIDFNSKKEDIVAKYGTPSDTYMSKEKDYESLSYNKDKYGDSGYRFIFVDYDGKGMRLLEVGIFNIEMDSSVIDNINGDVSKDAPALHAKYKAPTTLGDKWNSFTIKINDVVYQLPAPLPEFTKNSWTLVSNDEVLPSGDSQSGLDLRYDNYTARVGVLNYDDNANYYSNSFVVVFAYDKETSPYTFELPGGVTQASTIEEVEAAFGKGKIDDTSSYRTRLEYGEYNAGIEFTFDKETKVMSRMRITNEVKEFK